MPFLAGFISLMLKEVIVHITDAGSLLRLCVGDELDHESQTKGNIISSKVLTPFGNGTHFFFNVIELRVSLEASPAHSTPSLPHR